MRWRRFLICTTLNLCGLWMGLFQPAEATAQSQDLNVQVRAIPNPVRLNQTFRLEITVEGADAQGIADVDLPDLSFFASYLGSQGTSQSIQIINGRMSVSKTFTYVYMATKVGSFTIPPVTVRAGGKAYSSNPVSLQVVSGTTRSSQGAPGARGAPSGGRAEEQIFLRAKVNKRRVYQGEPVIVTYSLYTRLNVTGYAITKLPSTTGFWAEDMDIPQPPPTYEEVIDGVRYVVADIKKMALFPTSAGELEIAPMVVDCEVRVRRSSQPRDFFDAFFDDPFFGRTVRKSLSSEPIRVRVLPLPEKGKPADFSGAVGKFRMTARLDKDSVLTNEAVTLTVKIEGSGNLRVVDEPRIELPPDLERYEPKISQRIDKSGDQIRGSKTFEYVLIPRFPGEQRIKPIRFVYFDPDAGTYRTLRSPEFVIRVRRGREAIAVAPGLSKEEVRMLGQDIRFIKTDVKDWERIGRRLHRSPAFYVGLLFPLIVLGLATGYRRQQDRLATDVALARARKAQKSASQRLKKSRGLLRVETQKEFYAEIARALTGFLADKFNMPAAGLVSETIQGELQRRKVPDEMVQEVLSLLDTCDFQRFAPAASDTKAMEETLRTAERLIAQLEKTL